MGSTLWVQGNYNGCKSCAYMVGVLWDPHCGYIVIIGGCKPCPGLRREAWVPHYGYRVIIGGVYAVSLSGRSSVGSTLWVQGNYRGGVYAVSLSGRSSVGSTLWVQGNYRGGCKP